MVEHVEMTGGENVERRPNLPQWMERVAVRLVLCCDNRRYEGGSGFGPGRAGVTWAQIELSAEAKFCDALAG